MLSGRVDEMDKAFAELVEAKRSGKSPAQTCKPHLHATKRACLRFQNNSAFLSLSLSLSLPLHSVRKGVASSLFACTPVCVFVLVGKLTSSCFFPGQGDEILEKLQEKFTTAATKLAEHLEQVKRSNSSTEDYAVLAEKLKGKQQVIEKASHLVGKWDQRLQELINTAEKEIS